MKNSDYWKKRFELLEESQHQQGVQCYAELEKQYRQAQRQIEGQIQAWYGRFASNNGVTIQEAKRMLTSKELAELKWDINQYIQYGQENALSGTWVKELENASARFHISRLEALKLQTQQSLEVMFGNQLDSIDGAMRNIYKSGYYHTAFEIQKGVGVGWDFSTLDDKQIAKVINKPWAVDGKNFSERIWGNRQKLVNELNQTLTQNIMLGKDPQKAIDAIAKKMNSSKKNAGKLVMTEKAFFSSAAQKDCFAELDVEQFEIVATLDSHTSEICQEMDGKHFEISKWEVGVNAPPFHPWCRSTTVPYFDDEFDAVGERAARGADGKTYYIPADMKYKDWKQKFVKDSISDDTKKNYVKYQQVLGDNSPSIEEFAKIQYNEDDWKAFKAYTSSIKSGELTPLADFKLYQNISKEMDEKLVGIVTSNGITITGKSNHSIARVIGSVEQRRSGVSADDVLDALTNKDAEILPVKELKNGKSQKFKNQKVEVSINPDTGNVIQVNPTHDRKKVKA
jgi:SPP1 gp7 family putative phage head morphogenesis protein|nr:MAG TPA: minor capsid protein [Caudoviricetes sp.]